jgi:FkbM family methyltransferase
MTETPANHQHATTRSRTMSSLVDNLLASLQERARHFVARRQRVTMEASLGITGAERFDAEMLATLASIRAIVPERPNVVIDVGAHRGCFSAAADAFFDLEAIYCFEPDADLHEDLRRTVDSRKLHLFGVVVSDHCGVGKFFLHPDKSMNSSVAVDAEALDHLFPSDPSSEISTTEISTSTLDAMLESVEFKPSHKVLLKIDTQGNELNVLRGASATIEKVSCCLIEHMFCTPYTRSYRFEDLVARMADYGFTCEGALSLRRRKTHEVSAVDFLFARARGRATSH